MGIDYTIVPPTNSVKKYRMEFVGKRFGFLTVIKFHGRNKWKVRLWLCKCDCGNEKIATSNVLQSGNTRSCGCYKRVHSITHGYRYKRVYKLWQGIALRCKESCPEHKYYFDKGIKPCKRWSKFVNFLEDMGEPPTNTHTLDRKNNNKGYCKSNCRWATWSEQARNRPNSMTFEYKGVTKTRKEWGRFLKMNNVTFNKYLERGYSFQEIYKIYTAKTTIRVPKFFYNKKQKI